MAAAAADRLRHTHTRTRRVRMDNNRASGGRSLCVARRVVWRRRLGATAVRGGAASVVHYGDGVKVPRGDGVSHTTLKLEDGKT